MSGISPAIVGITGPISLAPCPPHDFRDTHFGAAVSVIQPIGQQRNGDWAVLVVFLEDATHKTLKRGDLAISRDAWLEAT